MEIILLNINIFYNYLLKTIIVNLKKKISFIFKYDVQKICNKITEKIKLEMVSRFTAVSETFK